MRFWKKRLYVDAAAATPLGKSAQSELLRLLPFFGNPGGLHREAVEAKRELEAARNTVADAVGAHADEIVITASGTEANNLCIQGVLRPLLRERGEVHAITSAIEHPSVLEPLRALEDEGLVLTELPVDGEGLVDPKGLREVINETTAFVSIQLVNSEVGTIQSIRELAKEIRHIRNVRRTSDVRHLPLYFHTDACQAPLWLPLHVEKLGCDLMTLDGQKMMGPKGVGCLYIKRGVSIEPLLWGGGQEWGVRSGTENVPLVGAFAAALKEAQEGVEARAEKISAVRGYLWDEIKHHIPDTVLNGPSIGLDMSKGSPCYRIASNLNFSIQGLDGEMAVVALDAEGIAASTRSACAVGEDGPSHVLAALGISEQVAKNALRITLLPDSTKQEVLQIVTALKIIVKRYRSMV